MSFDNSRFIFDAWKDYFGVVMEQGRVQLDSDWNEWLAELNRRIQAGTMDTMGRAVYPSTTPYAFKIAASSDSNGNHIAIGAGRMYVDGLLAENHGPAASAQWDPALDEMSGAPQILNVPEVTIDYTHQPYLPGATLPPGNGPFLAYLDVWRRAITYLEDPLLVDKAVNVDTTGRLQTIWQVKLLDISGSPGATCSSPDSDIPAWQKLIAPSAAQLTNGTVSNTPSGPCCLTSNTGFTGVENQFYRVEIHQKGVPAAAGAPTTYPLPAGSQTATFKWSRDNASVQTGVTGITSVTNTAGNSASQLTVLSMGRDQVLGFAPGNWIEITDDWLELNGNHGELHQIDSVDFVAKTITLDSLVSAASFPTTSGQTDPNRHTRITRWDQSGKVYLSDGVTVWMDLGVAGATGDIPVPPAGTTLILENGVTVAFGLNPASSVFCTADFWAFAARTADGSVDPLTQAHPFGIGHHYARLAIVTFPSSAPDCRVEWPPSAGGSGCCGCTVTVQPADLASGQTLQGIIDKYQNLLTPTTICLMPGRYSLPSSLRFKSSHANITIAASQPGTVTIEAVTGQEPRFTDGMVVFDNVNNVGLRGMYFGVPMAPFTPPNATFAGLPVAAYDPDVQLAINNLVISIGVRAVNCSGMTIEACEFGFADFEEDLTNPNGVPFAAGIYGSGQCSNWKVEDTVFGGVGRFLGGVVIAPSVSINPPPSVNTPAPAPSAAPANPVVAGQPGVPQAAILASRLSNRFVLGGFNTVFGVGGVAASLSLNGGKVLPSLLDQSVFTGNTFDGMTVASVIYGRTETVEFTKNRADNCSGGFWFVSPAAASQIALDPQGLAVIGLSIAMGYPLPQGDTTPATQFVSVAASPAAIRIFTEPAPYVDSQGNTWTPDVKSPAVTITGGTLNQPNPRPAISGALPASTDQALYQSERYGNSFSYTFKSLPKGFYTVRLKFSEIFYSDPKTNKGVRIFNVAINGAQVLTQFDIVADVGGADVADDKVFPNVLPDAQGQIVVQFTGTFSGSDINAKIAAAEVDPQWGSPTTKNNEFTFFYLQLEQLAQQGFAGALANATRLRVDASEMLGLSAPGLLFLGEDSLQTGETGSLMMSGNRLEGTIAIQSPAYAFLGDLLFVALAGISSLARCLVTGNTLVNDLQGEGRLSLVVDERIPQTPAIMLSGNLLQGRLDVLPNQRYPASLNVPYPMNSWDFLNTVIP